MAHICRLRLTSLFSSRLIKQLKNGALSHSRNYATAPGNEIVAVRLDHRSLLHIDGNDSLNFLQGLITNDIQQLNSGSHSLYAMFLNIKGRVMYDALFYKSAEANGIFLECDKAVVSRLEKHLKMYRLKKDVQIQHMQEMDVWAAFNPQLAKFDKNCSSTKSDFVEKGVAPSDIVATQHYEEISLDLEALTSCNVILFRDPRLSLLGVRILCSGNENVASLLELSLDNDISHYHLLRYKLGIAEGVTDLPPGESFPLEANCDYLNGVNFHKGCYIGQELTARVHHTGVVRKRLMPILLEEPLKSTDVSAVQVTDAKGKLVGKMRGVLGTFGIALLRVSEALNSSSLHVDGVKACTVIPSWWPCQTTKEAEAKVSA